MDLALDALLTRVLLMTAYNIDVMKESGIQF